MLGLFVPIDFEPQRFRPLTHRAERAPLSHRHDGDLAIMKPQGKEHALHLVFLLDFRLESGQTPDEIEPTILCQGAVSFCALHPAMGSAAVFSHTAFADENADIPERSRP